jgi:hypothetical protein
MNKLDFLDGQEPAEPDVVTSSEPADAPEAEAAKDTPPTDPAPEPAPSGTAVPATVTPPEPGHVPLSAMLDEREKRQAAERRAQELERQQAQRQPVAPPDPYEDPAAFADFQAQQFQQAQLNIRLDLSEDLARGKHGDEVVTKAQQWALERYARSPAFQQEVLTHRNPYEFVVQEYQRDQFVSQVQPADYDAFKAWQAAQAAASAQTPLAAPAAPPLAATPPRSLASATSAGGASAIPQGPGTAFDSVIK